MTAMRNPDVTRERLLQAAFQEIYRRGFQAASLDAILARAGVTKGALYHHFPNKKALGYAVVDELIRQEIVQLWLRPLEGVHDPVETLIGILQGLQAEISPEFLELGCPLNNLAQEMSPVDEGFRQRLEEIFRVWREGLRAAFQRGQEQGSIRCDIDPAQTAIFVLATIEGALSLAKNSQDSEILYACGKELYQYMHTLRPQHAAP